jgi:tRNA dimethylallyltransferase
LLVGGTGLYLRSVLNGLSDLPLSDPDNRRKLQARIVDAAGRQQLYQELLRDDPESAARIHPNDTHRLLRAMEIYLNTGIPWSKHIKKQRPNPQFSSVVKIGLTCERDLLYDRINKRVDQMIEQGFVTEVEQLLDRGYSAELKAMQSIGYRHIIRHLAGQWSLPETIKRLARDTRRYAKRQYTWFNNDPQIKWFNPAQEQEVVTYIKTTVSKIDKNSRP